MIKRRRTKAQLRNLKQYQDATDEELDEILAEQEVARISNSNFEERIDNKIKQFEEDYDLDDLKFNDLETLRALCQALITLEDYEQFTFNIRETKGISVNTINLLQILNKLMSDIRRDISKLQEDLKISRKIRQSDRQENVRQELEILEKKAREFYKQKMQYIYCPKCRMLLSTIWFLYFDSEKNSITLECKRPINKKTGEICGNVFTVSTKDLKQGKNIKGVPNI